MLLRNQILDCDDPQCDEVNCRIYWDIINKNPNAIERYKNTVNDKYCDAVDIDYKMIVEALLEKS